MHAGDHRYGKLEESFQSIRLAVLAAALLEFFAGSAGAGSVSAGGLDGNTLDSCRYGGDGGRIAIVMADQ